MGHAKVVPTAAGSASRSLRMTSKLQQGHSVERLSAEADEITADATVDDPLLGDLGQLAVNFEDAHT